ncbi:MAG: hypothetical protein JNL82_04395 [Myxococcales bacterium]|nr:hypothetical protein [Myxococcales bacterium]
MPKQTLSVPPADLTALLAEIDAARPDLAVTTPERQRLAMTAWIARARAAEARGRFADRHVREVAQVLQALGQTWWPGNVYALARTTRPQRVFPETPEPLQTWDAVADEAAERLKRAPSWSDEAARMPRPFAPAAMFAGLAETLVALGGPLGVANCPSPAALGEAARRIDELRRIAAELRWLRGCAPGSSWGAAIGRLRGLARALGPDGASIAAQLDPAFAPASWAHHLGRDPRSEALLADTPGPDAGVASVLAWLLRAFDVLDNPTLARLCRPFQSQLLELRPELTDRRDRRRLTALQQRVIGAVPAAPDATAAAVGSAPPAQAAPDVAHARALFAGRRALFISNRSFPELETRLHDELGLECEAVASVGAVRRRQALLQRIRGGTYDLVLVAHGFSGHADTEQFACACRSAGILYCAVGKGRFTRVVSCLLAAGSPARVASPPRLSRPSREFHPLVA